MARETIRLDPGLLDVSLAGAHGSMADRARLRAADRARHAADLAAAREAGHRQGRAEADTAFAGQLMAQRQEVAALVMNIVRRLLAGVVPDAARVEALIEQALAEAPADPAQTLEVSLSPDDLRELEAMGGSGLRERHPNLTLRADPALAANDCTVRGEFGLIDARMETKLKAIEGLLVNS